MGRERRGFIVERGGRLWVRVQFTDASGVRRERMRRASNMKEANKIRKQLIRELDDHGEKSLDGDRVKFADLARAYQEKKLFPAKIINGRKVAGVKSLAPVLGSLKSLTEGLGKKFIKTITHSDIESYKLMRLDTPTIHGKQRAIASVNRELELLRTMFRFAIRQGWLSRSPFDMGDPLISKMDETRRERTLSQDEERRLLEACTGRRAHLRPLLIAALDTAARRGELFKLCWRDVDFSSRTITIIAENSKTARGRTVGMTQRLYDELTRLREESPEVESSLVFGITSTVKNAFKSALKEAEIEGYRWHDGRHTAITRMVQTRYPSAVIMRVSGHSQSSTFQRYVNPDTEAITNIADALAKLNDEATSQLKLSVEESVN
jgi:integrase